MGPYPPSGAPHRYYFTLYALNCTLPPSPDVKKEELLKAIQRHVIDTAVLMGTYQRGG
jgi:phosphatidylethanolamine-binding protein (PEBP) family uncharacterized protein